MEILRKSGHFRVRTSDESEPSWLKPQLELEDFQLGSAMGGQIANHITDCPPGFENLTANIFFVFKFSINHLWRTYSAIKIFLIIFSKILQ